MAASEAGTWTTEIVGEHPCDVYTPPIMNPHGYTVLYLHGVHMGKLNDKTDFVRQFQQQGLRVVAPVTRRSWWSDRICPDFDLQISAEAHVLRRVLPYMKERWNVAPPQIALLGTSMGGQGALKFAYKYPDLFPVVAAISPAIDFQQRIENPEDDEPLLEMYDDPEAARQDTATLHIHPLNWPRHQFFCCDPTDHSWFDGADRLRMKLYSLGVPHVCDLETVGGGHGFQYYGCMAERAVEFLVEALDKERRRV